MILMDAAKKINGNAPKNGRRSKKLNVASLNSHLICVLCSGYYIEATAIVECLHTFCRSCVIKYLQSSNFCPICDVQIHQAKPWSSLRPDKTLQDLVYKLVPGLYQNEMRRRRQFYTRLGRDPEKEAGEDGGFLRNGARFFANDDSISLSLEYYTGIQTNENEDQENDDVEKIKILNDKPKRYLQCPAAVTVRHLKKFLRMKYGIGLDSWVDIIYNDECLPDNFTLIDVAYTFTWKRTSPMRFSYRIYSKNTLRAVKSQKNFQTPRLDEEDKKKSKRQSSLEQQKQNEYLGNFNLNPTNSSIYRNQSCNKTRHNKSNNNNNNNSIKNNNTLVERKYNKKDDEYIFRDSQDSEDESPDKIFQSSEESNNSGLQIISEKDESLKGNSEDSRGSSIAVGKRKFEGTVASFSEEALDGFSTRKLLRSKHKLEGKKEKRKSDGPHNEKDKRRRSVAHSEDLDNEKSKKKFLQVKRRKSMADEYSLKREVAQTFSIRMEEDAMSNLKNEALRKVFVTKDKSEVTVRKKDDEFRRKKRKKSKHHESEAKKRKVEVVTASPSIMSFAKDELKLKFKLTPNKPVAKVSPEEGKEGERKEEPEEVTIKDDETSGNSDKEVKKPEGNECKRSVSDKERLLHLRAVRHKTNGNKSSPKDYITTPPSLTISKIDSSEQQPVKSSLVESRPSLEIMLVSSADAAKIKKSESQKETDAEKAEILNKESCRRPEVVDNFGVLDLSEKSTRTKDNSSTSNSSSPKEVTETIEKCRKSTTHQSILHIAQTLVNRKLSPILPENHLIRGGFDGTGDSSATAAAMRNLKTLSDTAVNILMAAQSKSFAGCAAAAAAAAAAAEFQKRPFSSLVLTPHKALPAPNSTKQTKDSENGAGLKIPVYPIGRDRTNPIPPVPNLHEIYPKGRGKPLSLPKPPTQLIKPGQNQTVRQIPNPFVVLNRQTNQNPAKPISTSENGGEPNPASEKQKTSGIPPLQSIKTKVAAAKSEEVTLKNGVTEGKATVPKLASNTKTVQNGTDSNFFGLKNGAGLKLNNNNTTTMRKMENLAKNIETVAAGLTARAVSNAMIDAK